MSLVAGRGPFGSDRAGWFSPAVPDSVVYIEPHPRRIQAFRGGEVVIDTDRERVLAYLRAAPLKDRIGGPFYPPVAVEMALALEKDGLVRLVDYQCYGGGCWLVDLLERER